MKNNSHAGFLKPANVVVKSENQPENIMWWNPTLCASVLLNWQQKISRKHTEPDFICWMSDLYPFTNSLWVIWSSISTKHVKKIPVGHM